MKKVGIIFGGRSTEHDVSVLSGKSILEKIDKEKYEIYPIYIDKQGNWYEYQGEKIENITKYLEKIDIAFPVMHGKYGEDGSIQGFLEMLKIPYVGCNILPSAIGMDKVYSKIIFEKAGLKQAKYCYIKSIKGDYIYIDKDFNEEKLDLDDICKKVENNLKYPMFVKPSNSGSSVGINKVKNKEELKNAIIFAEKFDYKVLVEEGVKAREIECSVLGNETIEASGVGEIISAEEFYSYNAKYKSKESKVVLLDNLEEEEIIKKQAVKAFKAIDGRGLARVDFFLLDNKEVYINEINTMPGFTSISMYAKLWEKSGVPYTELIDRLINLA